MGIEANARHVAEELLRDARPDMTAAACEPLAGLTPVGEVPATLSSRFVGQVVDEVSHSIRCFREYLPSADVMLTSDDGTGQGMSDVLARIGRTVALLRPTAVAPIASACEYVVQNIETDPGIKDVAAHLFLNDKYLGSLFHKQTGMTYAVWVKRVRLERAKSLLSQGGLRIGEVARRLGYQDVEYFGRMFRRQTGFLPSHYVWRCDDDCAPVAAPPRFCSLPQSSLLVGVVGCFTGPNGYLFGTSRYMYELAARHINDAGGIGGRRVELAFEDYGCDASAADVCARRLISDRGACVLVGGGTSIGREAIRPVVDELCVPFLYDTMYEGGVADHFTFCVSSVPEQNILPAVDYLAERGARRFFIIVTDYSYGILTAECIKHHLTARGCEVGMRLRGFVWVNTTLTAPAAPA